MGWNTFLLKLGDGVLLVGLLIVCVLCSSDRSPDMEIATLGDDAQFEIPIVMDWLLNARLSYRLNRNRHRHMPACFSMSRCLHRSYFSWAVNQSASTISLKVNLLGLGRDHSSIVDLKFERTDEEPSSFVMRIYKLGLNTQKGAQTVAGEQGPGQTVTYTIKTTWTRTLPNHLIIFPSLSEPGTRCESNQHCLDQQLYLRDVRDENNSSSYRLDVSIERVEHLADYVLLLTDGVEGHIRMFKLSPESPSQMDLNMAAPLVRDAPGLQPPGSNKHDSAGLFSKSHLVAAAAAGAGLMAIIALLALLIVRHRNLCSNHLERREGRKRRNDCSPSDIPEPPLSDRHETLPGSHHPEESRVMPGSHHPEESRVTDSFKSDSRDIPLRRARARLCHRRISSPNIYETIDSGMLQRSSQAAQRLPQKREPYLEASKTHAKTGFGKNRATAKSSRAKKAEPFYTIEILPSKRFEHADMPPLQYYLLRLSNDNVHNVEVLDAAIEPRCPVHAEGDGEYLTVLDATNEQRCPIDAEGDGDYLTVLDATTDRGCPVDAEDDGGYVTVLDATIERRCPVHAEGDGDYLTVLDCQH
ncbi:hypothetical protein PoB_005633300 [Plakobranchus ocellatus]|uniref:Cadherin domain-containing protein n=1 Tax=Plakobranchus ocellatus TaxID=259542 RepID=A0AAV4CD59_9GAST|nr:hypothetical protein PoB_005633300 [Plakobranchus ocellatus]